MKKLLKLVLGLFLCFLLCACGDEVGGEVKLVNVGENQYYLEFSSQKAFEKSIRKIEITKDNWNEYFEDYSISEHYIHKNDFGDIEEEYDLLKVGFGLKDNICGLVQKVSFKVDGFAMYGSSSMRKDSLDEMTYTLYKANEDQCKVVNYMTDDIVETKANPHGVKDYYVIEFDNSETNRGIQLRKNNVIDVIGTLYVIDLPDGLYNGEDILQVDFGKDGKNGGTGFGVGNIIMFYKE